MFLLDSCSFMHDLRQVLFSWKLELKLLAEKQLFRVLLISWQYL